MAELEWLDSVQKIQRGQLLQTFIWDSGIWCTQIENYEWFSLRKPLEKVVEEHPRTPISLNVMLGIVYPM